MMLGGGNNSAYSFSYDHSSASFNTKPSWIAFFNTNRFAIQRTNVGAPPHLLQTMYTNTYTHTHTRHTPLQSVLKVATTTHNPPDDDDGDE